MRQYKRSEPSKLYKNVYLRYADDRIYYIARVSIGNTKFNKYCNTEREAAIAVDMFLINNKKEPINILKKK